MTLPWVAITNEDPELTLELAAKLKGRDLDGSVRSTIGRAIGELALKDEDLARRKLEEFTGPERAAAVCGFANAWTARDPAAALEWLSTLPASDRQNSGRVYYGSSDVLLSAFDDWIRRDADQARAWAAGLPEGALRQQIQIALARSYTRDDPAAGMQIVAAMGNAADTDTAKGLARAWADKDGQAAANWAVTQAPPALQEKILPMIVEQWGDDDEKAVSSWVAQFPDGELRDRCIVAFLHRPDTFSAAAQDQIAEFDAWFDTMTDPKLRADAAMRNFMARKESDPAAARAWLSSLTNVDQATIQKALQKGRP
jgi:hypothetical protein